MDCIQIPAHNDRDFAQPHATIRAYDILLTSFIKRCNLLESKYKGRLDIRLPSPMSLRRII